jgi:5-(carboxyamino)imidazole ribonucleotide mutase
METKVLIVMGSRSDLPSMEGCMKQLDDFGVGYEVRVLSAHRTPNEVIALSASARDRGIQVIIAAAGGAAHLAGVLASSTPLPVIGIPIKSAAFDGMDALLATVMMPTGIPVSTVAVDGAANAAILAVEMLALSDDTLDKKLEDMKLEMAQGVAKKDADMQRKAMEL